MTAMKHTTRHAAVAFAAWLCAALSLMTVLLGAAPFTPAPMALAITVPLAALAAWCGHFMAPLVTAFCVPAAIAISPIMWSQFQSAPAAAWLAWVSFWSIVVVSLAARGLASKAGEGIE
jgi:hypothetical protein